MIVLKLFLIYLFIGAYFAFVPLSQPIIKEHFQEAKEKFGAFSTTILLIGSCLITMFFWPIFLIKK